MGQEPALPPMGEYGLLWVDSDLWPGRSQASGFIHLNITAGSRR